jgi:hypothetical protein
MGARQTARTPAHLAGPCRNGHNSVETTQVYLHCIPQFASSITSPLDAMPQASNVLPFTPPHTSHAITGASAVHAA